MAAWRYASQDYRTFSDHLYENDKINHQSDYDDFYVIVKADVEEQIQNAEEFCAAVRTYLEGKKVTL